MKHIKSALLSLVLFSFGFFSALSVPLTLGINDRMVEINWNDEFVRNEFNCGENPDAAPTGGMVCPKFYNVQIGGGWNDADGGLSLSSKGDIFVKGSFFVDAPGTEEYGGVIFGNNGLYSEGYNGSGVVAVSYDPDGNVAEGRVATWIPGPNPRFPVYYNYGLFTPDNARIEGNLLANTLIAQQGDGVMHIYANARKTVVHGDLEVTGHITECTECAPGLIFNAIPMVIVKGDVTTLTWSSTDADSVTISNAANCRGNGQPNGNCSLAPTDTTTYTAVARNDVNENEETVSRTVDVLDLTLTAVPNNIRPGEPVTLSWSSQEAASLSILADGNPLPQSCPAPQVNQSQSCQFRVEESVGFSATAIHETGMLLVKRVNISVTQPVEYVVENTSYELCGPNSEPTPCRPPVYTAALALCDSNDALLECITGQPTQQGNKAGCATRAQQNTQTTARARCLDSAEPYDR